MKIYRTKKDYRTFLKILGDIHLNQADSRIMAWSLMPNHFHLLIFINKTPLSSIMRALLTKYAMYFNRQHKRKGHLFQNRYKSILCQEDEYLMMLVQYIHLNPYKARITKTLSELDAYEFTGHKALIGTQANPWQDTDEVLSYFNNDPKEYRQYIKTHMNDKISMDGGGLLKTIQLDNQSPEQFKNNNRHNPEAFDDRILGRGSFVSNILNLLENHPEKYYDRPSLEELINSVVKKEGISKAHLSLKNKKVQSAKREIKKKAIWQHKYKASEVSRAMNIHESNISRMLQTIS